VEAKICVALSGRAAELEFLGAAHTGAGSDLRNVRTLLLNLAQEGYFSSLGYKAEPTDTLISEMDQMVERSMDKTRQTLRAHSDRVEELVAALLKQEELDEERVAAILGERPVAD
jgi:ATP-dependent Zn protease